MRERRGPNLEKIVPRKSKFLFSTLDGQIHNLHFILFYVYPFIILLNRVLSF